ncbi:hypothetical protein KCP70_11275 [Salmonella enterica subsp. enterica]|nr:hypothetical protein KCP70_11275 [Salmonella enterica subsp. enterica]
MLSVLSPWLLEDKTAMTARWGWRWPAGLRCWRWSKPYSACPAARKTSLSATGEWWRRHPAGGDDYRHRLQPDYSVEA